MFKERPDEFSTLIEVPLIIGGHCDTEVDMNHLRSLA